MGLNMELLRCVNVPRGKTYVESFAMQLGKALNFSDRYYYDPAEKSSYCSFNLFVLTFGTLSPQDSDSKIFLYEPGPQGSADRSMRVREATLEQVKVSCPDLTMLDWEETKDHWKWD